ncbi:MAG: hypothetical protein IPM11_11280 [Micropruina sp.]|nr:hypothetical protein [Micropruina sp.]
MRWRRSLQRCCRPPRELALVITAPEAIGVSGERVLAVAPLATGSDGAAARGVVGRRAVEPGASRAEIRQVARQSAGVPLAIELLAANPSATAGTRQRRGWTEIVRAAVDACPTTRRPCSESLSYLPMGAPPSLSEQLAAGLARTSARQPRLLRELVASLVV